MELMKQEEVKGFPYYQLIALGSGIAVSAAIGDVAGITTGAISVLGQFGLDRFITPLISKRQTVRLFQWGIQAAEGIAQRLEDDEKFRTDGFFQVTPTNRSKIDEVVESTLKKVIDTTEEPKIKFMAHLTENVHFDSDLDMDTYRRLLKLLDELSYRQLCIIKLFMNADQIDLDNLGKNVTPNLSSILTDCLELNNKEFISSDNPLMQKIHELYVGSSGNIWTASGSDPEYPGFAHQGFSNTLSENLFKFAKLDKIPDEDVNAILEELRNDSKL